MKNLPTNLPDALNLIKGQRTVLRNMTAKIERQRKRLHVQDMELTKRNEVNARMAKEIDEAETAQDAYYASEKKLAAENARLRAEVDRYRTAWRSAMRRANVLCAEVTRRAPLLGQYAAEIKRLRAGRAAVLREAADVAVHAARGTGDSEAGHYAASVAAGIAKTLRRMADEAQQAE